MARSSPSEQHRLFYSHPLTPMVLQKNKSNKIDRHGKQALNFQVTINLGQFANVFVLMAVPILFSMIETNLAHTITLFFATTPLLLIGLFTFFQGVKNAIKVLSDLSTNYPLVIKFVN